MVHGFRPAGFLVPTLYPPSYPLSPLSLPFAISLFLPLVYWLLSNTQARIMQYNKTSAVMNVLHTSLCTFHFILLKGSR